MTGLILVDAGLGVEDVNEPRRLGFLFNAMVRPRLDVAETALRQVADLGFRPSDVRHIVPTHLDLDHAGGICDFPDAAVHVFAAELRAASHRSTLERAKPLSQRADRRGQEMGARSRKRANPGSAFRPCARFRERATRCCWCRFPAIRAGIAASRSGERTIGCSIAATPISITPKSSPTAAPRRRACAGSSRWWSVDGAERRANQARLRELARARCRRGQAHLLARHCRLRRDEERAARS